MRIISGEKKGLKLEGFDDIRVRPTTDRAKESLFNIINQKVLNSNFLDLYGGTGAIGLEAKSRGAKEVDIIDINPEIIKKNQQKSKLNVNILKSESLNFIQNTSKKYDIVFLDPPFSVEDDTIINLIDEIIKKGIIKQDGILILERMSKKENSEVFSKYENMNIRKYGKVSFVMIG